MLGQKGRGWLLLLVESLGRLQTHRGGRRRGERTNGAGVVLHQVLVGRERPRPGSRFPGEFLVLHGGGPLHRDQRAVAPGVSEVPCGLTDGTGEVTEDGTGHQAAGSPQSVGSTLLLRSAVLQTELTSVSTRHLQSCTVRDA